MDTMAPAYNRGRVPTERQMEEARERMRFKRVTLDHLDAAYDVAVAAQMSSVGWDDIDIRNAIFARLVEEFRPAPVVV